MNCKTKKFKIIKLKEGNILKLTKLKKRNSFNKEIYISEIKPKYKKGWNLHTKYKSLIFLIDGNLEFKVCKNKKKSKIQIYNLNLQSNNILEIPPNHWFSFRSKNTKKISKILNVLSGFHNKKETKKRPIKIFQNPLG